MSPNPCLRLSAVVLSFLLAGSVSAGYYRWIDDKGVTHFSDAPPGPDGKPVRPNGTTVIPMRENIRTQQKIEQIKNTRPVPPQLKRAPARDAKLKAQQLNEQELKEVKRQRLLCKRYEDRISWIDSRLRAGGYSVSQGNRLRKERRELSSKRSWDCLRG